MGPFGGWRLRVHSLMTHLDMADVASHGITPPLSLAGPSEADKRLQEALVTILRCDLNGSFRYSMDKAQRKWVGVVCRSCGLYESEQELEHRERVLSKLGDILREYALHEGLGGSAEKAGNAQRDYLQLRTFGSYRLGVHSPDADIDTYATSPCNLALVSVTDSLWCDSVVKPLHCTTPLYTKQLLPESADPAGSHVLRL